MKIFKTFHECASEANYRDLEMQEDEKNVYLHKFRKEVFENMAYKERCKKFWMSCKCKFD